jgi:DNA-binding MarR family transcriptional regulator
MSAALPDQHDHPSHDDVVAVADTFMTLMRSFTRAKARLLAAAQHDVEWSAHMVLRCLAGDGPMRSSAVADCLQSDPSTISRQVAAMVKDGLLERRADPDDGRASLLVLTPKARAVLAEHDDIRIEHFARMLDTWSERDVRRFAALLCRFTHDYDNASHDWITERIAKRTVSAGGNT